jgi:hypothetical protein
MLMCSPRVLQLSCSSWRLLMMFHNFLCSTSNTSVFEPSYKYLDSEPDSLDVYIAVITIPNVVCVLKVLHK